MYLSGDTVLISDIGEAGFSSDVVAEARTSLVCQTINLGIVCCREGDGNRAGDWYFPDGGGIVPVNGGNEGLDFTRSGFTQQVRLNRRNDAVTPTGVFECRVLDGDDMFIASITLTTGVCLFVCMCRCDVFPSLQSPLCLSQLC